MNLILKERVLQREFIFYFLFYFKDLSEALLTKKKFLNKPFFNVRGERS